MPQCVQATAATAITRHGGWRKGENVILVICGEPCGRCALIVCDRIWLGDDM
jgi:hypothetical protein